MHDIYDPVAYRDGIPYETFAWLRENRPVSWVPEPELPTSPAGPGFWAVMRYEDVRHVSRTPETFSASLGGTQLRDPDPADLPFLRTMLLNMDPPEHSPYRRLLSKAFTPQSLAGLDAYVAGRAEELLGRLREQGGGDIVEEVTDELALSALAHLLGIPESDRRFFFDWANRIIGYHDDEYRSEDGQADPRNPQALADLFAYADQLAAHRRETPGDDLISALVHGQVGGRGLTTQEFQNAFFLLAVAGNDTTRGALPGALLAMAEHPEQLAGLRADPGLIDRAVEECLRYAPSVIHFRRTATHDTTIGDVEVGAGQKVVVYYPSANRDPRAFARPEEFDITVERRRHVTFGYGPHACVAAALGRLQMRNLLAKVAEHCPGLRLAGPVERLSSNFVAGIKRMPVAFDT